jgi:hypothetical protein
VTKQTHINSGECSPIAQQLGMLLGYAIHMAGGTIKMPPMKAIEDFLVDNFAVDKSTDDNGNVILTLLPQTKGSNKVN